ncbi:hypothetical protein [Rhodopirellula bahusiensis]|uniref:Uncharacterized protein n=1 Tax=Rhodopirellula bahusiensis TaxID=2014065 RepID=A0A2G1VYI2_9BACT|nr:hypothetical protein [Rhodopirellula bahusiensis]PHQ31848.1 hypothetical protein CEE69_28655 [Rhodopirellula bahusiensis]
MAERDDTIGVLVHAEPTSLTDRLLHCVPPYGGSAIIYCDPCKITGLLCDCVLPMFPRLLHSITDLVFDGHRIIADDDRWVADPPFID